MKAWAVAAICAGVLLLCAAIFFAVAVVGCGGGYYNNDGSYRRATWKSSIAWTMAHPAFAAYGRLLLPWREGAASVTVPPMSYFWMCLTTGWNAGAVVGGVNFMIEREEAGGAHFFSFYDDEEVAADAETPRLLPPPDRSEWKLLVTSRNMNCSAMADCELSVLATMV